MLPLASFDTFWLGVAEGTATLLSSVTASIAILAALDRLLGGWIGELIQGFVGVRGLERTTLSILHDQAIAQNRLAYVVAETHDLDGIKPLILDLELIAQEAQQADNVWPGKYIKGNTDLIDRDVDPRVDDPRRRRDYDRYD